jgi:carbonic anhydrase
LGIKDIIVCGHSHCGAVNALLNPEAIREAMPDLHRWLSYAEATQRIVRGKYKELAPDALLNVAIQENVLVQLENLRTYPAVALGLARGDLKLHGWVYKIETGQVFAYDPNQSQYLSLSTENSQAIPPAARLTGAIAI